ncbi:MAG TPA: hypothetical protein VGO49_07465 [Bradyrhizobium sp.]|jgi:hypothetical protein|nr:hypothetical protein [Bradyrhizobium sp.]
MVTEPKTIREANFVSAGIEARLGLVQAMVWVVVGLLGTLIAGAGALYFQIGDLKTDIALIKTSVASINERLIKLDKNFEDHGLSALLRIEALVSPNRDRGRSTVPSAQMVDRMIIVGPSIVLAQSEIQFVLDMLKPDRTSEQGTFKIGDQLPDLILPHLPQVILERVPKLRGFRYTIDRNGAILLVADLGNHVLGIILPS